MRFANDYDISKRMRFDGKQKRVAVHFVSIDFTTSTSDNSPHNESNHDLKRFNPARNLFRDQTQFDRWWDSRAVHCLEAEI